MIITSAGLFKLTVAQIGQQLASSSIAGQESLLNQAGDSLDARIDITSEDGYVLGYIDFKIVTFERPMKPEVIKVDKKVYKPTNPQSGSKGSD